MRELAERVWFAISLLIGRALRAGRYSRTEIVEPNGEPVVRKRRSALAPLLVWLVGGLYRSLDTGVRVLPQREWVTREQTIYAALYDKRVVVSTDGTLTLPFLRGRTLAEILANSQLSDSSRSRSVELAVVALADLHRRGFTHADAMVDNVMVDLDAGVARWFDFENAHDASRAWEWRRADDVRALLASALRYNPKGGYAEVMQSLLRLYGDDTVVHLAETHFHSVTHRSLPFHLGQAPRASKRY